MKNYLTTAIGVLSAMSIASASVTIDFSIGEIRDAQGNGASIGSRGILIADVDGNGFTADYFMHDFVSASSSLAGGSISVGSLFGGDLVIGEMEINDALGFSGFNGSFANLQYPSGLQPGTALALVWFPTLFEAEAIFTYGTSYGFYSNLLVSEASGATMGFVAPSDGSINYLAVIDELIIGGSYIAVPTADDFTARAIPEPATYATLLGLAVIGLLLHRRNRA